MNKKQFIREVYNFHNSKTNCNTFVGLTALSEILDSMINVFEQSLINDRSFKLKDVLTVKVEDSSKGKRRVYNPHTGNMMEYDRGRSIKVKLGKAIREKINKG